MAGIKLKKLQTLKEDDYGLKAEALIAAIEEDRANGLLPFLLVATVGTTSTCAVDDVKVGAVGHFQSEMFQNMINFVSSQVLLHKIVIEIETALESSAILS